jgi:predicted phosphoribosyltransferase
MVAQQFHAPLDVVVAHKIGSPWQPEVAMGAVAEDGTVVWDSDRRMRAPVQATT